MNKAISFVSLLIVITSLLDIALLAIAIIAKQHIMFAALIITVKLVLLYVLRKSIFQKQSIIVFSASILYSLWLCYNLMIISEIVNYLLYMVFIYGFIGVTMIISKDIRQFLKN